MKMTWRRGLAYSQDLRDRVLAYSDAGELVGEIAAALFVSISYVSKVLSRRAQTGERCARPQRCHVQPKLAGLYDAIQAEVRARPDATLAELRLWLAQTHEVTASNGLMHDTLVSVRRRPRLWWERSDLGWATVSRTRGAGHR